MTESSSETREHSADMVNWLRQTEPEAAQRIPRFPSASAPQDPLGFDALREAAIALAQAASRAHWTDYNLHDPGVTLLEALCYALTEDVYASRQSVPELLGLRSGDVGTQHALHQAAEVLTCRPSTVDDYQRWLYEHWPQARHLQMQPLNDRRQRSTGLWHLSRQWHRADEDNLALALDQTRAYWAQRNLGEDLLAPQQLLQPRWVRLRLKIRISANCDVAELLAQLITRCDDHLAARPRRSALAAIPSAQRSAGPWLRQGWVSDEELARCRAHVIKFNDLALLLSGIEGLLKIDQLLLEETPALKALSKLSAMDAQEPLLQHHSSLRLRGSNWAVRMAWPSSAQDLDSWCIMTQGSDAPMSLHQLWQQLEDVRRTPRRETMPQVVGTRSDHDRGITEPTTAYVPASRHLPPVYHATGLRHSAALFQPTVSQDQRPTGQRLQWHAYLALLEQWLAHSRAQRQHLGELFDIGCAQHQSYWWDLPGPAQLPDLEGTHEGLYLKSRAQITDEIFDSTDAALERRSRVLDQLLALHGEQLDFRPLQGLACYERERAWSRHLLGCKQILARHLLTQTRDRGAAFDYSRPLLGQRNNTCPLNLRLSLQLGMAYNFPRFLMHDLHKLGVHLWVHDTPPQNTLPPPTSGLSYLALQLLPENAQHSRRALRALWLQLRQQHSLLRQPLSTELLRLAVRADHFVLQRQEDHLQLQQHLCLRGMRHDQYWALARVPNEQVARQLATQLHQLACALQRDSEGLHLVEHVLLRPTAQSAQTLSAFHRQRISLVLPGWTARGADLRFQGFCQHVLRMHAPAHLYSRAFFLQPQAMAKFENLYDAWLRAKREDCQQLRHPARSTQKLDACAVALSDFLRSLWRRS